MAKSYRLLRDRMSPAARREAEARAARILEEMALDDLRHAREKTQQELAGIMGVNQAAVSKLESRLDMYVSTLRGYIEALGGKLEITAHFPDKTVVRITQFEEENTGKKKKTASAAAAR